MVRDNVVVLVDKLPNESVPTAAKGLEDKQPLTRTHVLAYGQISSSQTHVASLAFAEVVENSSFVVVVEITMAATGAAREEKDERFTGWR